MSDAEIKDEIDTAIRNVVESCRIVSPVADAAGPELFQQLHLSV